MGPLLWTLFWTSGDVSSGFQSHSGQTYLHLAEVYMMYIPLDAHHGGQSLFPTCFPIAKSWFTMQIFASWQKDGRRSVQEKLYSVSCLISPHLSTVSRRGRIGYFLFCEDVGSNLLRCLELCKKTTLSVFIFVFLITETKSEFWGKVL